MKLIEVKLKNFRCYQEVNIRFKNRIPTFVGENNVGKSSIFVAVQKILLSTGNKIDTQFAADIRHGKSQLTGRCRFELSQPEIQEVLDLILPNDFEEVKRKRAIQLLTPHFHNIDIHLVYKDANKTTLVYAGNKSMYIDDSKLTPNLEGSTKNAPIAKLFNSIDETTTAKTFEERMKSMSWQTNSNILPAIGEIILQRYKIIADFRMRPDSLPRSNTTESLNGNEIANVLFNLKNSSDPSNTTIYTSICDYFNKLFPLLTINAVTDSRNQNNTAIQVITKGTQNPLSIENIGSGISETIVILTNLLSHNDCIYVVEEPELHLHPQAKRFVYSLLKETAKNKQIIVVTHDSSFVDPDDLESLHRVYHQNQQSEVVHLAVSLSDQEKDKLRRGLTDIGQREIVFARVVILVEDETTRNYLLACSDSCKYTIDQEGISVVEVGGQDGYGPYIKLLDNLKIPFICLRDNDWEGTNIDSYTYRSLGCEIEDFLKSKGYEKLYEEAKREVGNCKQRMGKYVGQHTTEGIMPDLFSKLLEDAIQLSKNG